ncbi:MAG: non-canonical purine NTP diphosphatase [Flavobacteriaceae bacterium]
MKLVFATHNSNKLKEVQLLLPRQISLLSLKDIGCHEEISETGATLEENARIKADYVTVNYGIPCFADDTGLLVDALNGAPGVYSARYAGAQKNSEDNMAKLLSELKNYKDRSAKFKTIIALNLQTERKIFEGTVEGSIITKKKGSKGFGYDPIFMPNDFNTTFAELSLAIKNKISHRAKAIQHLIQYLKSLQNGI